LFYPPITPKNFFFWPSNDKLRNILGEFRTNEVPIGLELGDAVRKSPYREADNWKTAKNQEKYQPGGQLYQRILPGDFSRQ
jgi:hypothetical protein